MMRDIAIEKLGRWDLALACASLSLVMPVLTGVLCRSVICLEVTPPHRPEQGTIVPGNIVPIIVAILSMDLKRAMATNLLRARYARGLTQEELADRAGLSARRWS
jgi:hypothetical protein